MKTRTVALVVAGMVVAGGVRGPADENGAVAFKVIVHPSVAGQKISRDVVAEIYLGKVARWADGRHIMPVDLTSTSAVREAFSNAVLGLRVEEVKNHWLRKSASQGRRPPLTKASDEEMIAAVAAEAGAIGYVSAPAPLPPTVREVRID